MTTTHRRESERTVERGGTSASSPRRRNREKSFSLSPVVRASALLVFLLVLASSSSSSRARRRGTDRSIAAPVPFFLAAEAWVSSSSSSSPCVVRPMTRSSARVSAATCGPRRSYDVIARRYVRDDVDDAAGDDAADSGGGRVEVATTTIAAEPSHPSVGAEGIVVKDDDDDERRPPESSSSEKTQQQQQQKLDLRILLVDNHDSYTYNLYQHLSTMTSRPVEVVMNDAYPSYDAFLASLNGGGVGSTDVSDSFDCVILSPGPGRPSRPSDVGILLETIRRNPSVPVLGVCLGHQALGYVYGADVTLSPCGPVHGRTSAVWHDERERGQGRQDEGEGGGGGGRPPSSPTCELFRGLPQGFEVVRYHSLAVDVPDDDQDSEIEPIAWCDGIERTGADEHDDPDDDAKKNRKRVCMALRHKTLPHYGVQFHPESVGTGEAGYRLLRNFCDFAHERKLHAPRVKRTSAPNGDGIADDDDAQTETEKVRPSLPSKYRVVIHKIENEGEEGSRTPLPSPKRAFEALYASRSKSFWLDSSTGESLQGGQDVDREGGGCPIAANSRFSIMGSDDGPLARRIEYFGREHDPKRRGLRVTNAYTEEVEEEPATERRDVLSYLRTRLVEKREFVDRADVVVSFDDKGGGTNATLRTIEEFGETSRMGGMGDEDGLPFDYRGGYVGYLGYEVRHDTECRIFEQEGGAGCDADEVPWDKTNANVPTAAFLFVDRNLLYDHETGDWYIIGVAENEDCGVVNADERPAGTGLADTLSWMWEVNSELASLGETAVVNDAPGSTTDDLGRPAVAAAAANVAFVPNRSKPQYQRDISRSHEEIRNGESYELCVTNQLEAEIALPATHPSKARHESPYELYERLRRKNPAPFSAFFNFHEEEEADWGTGARRRATISSSSVSICCSSPERFISVKKSPTTSKAVDGGPKREFVVESKPIKGTAARYTGSGREGVDEPPELIERVDAQIAANLLDSVKDRAENLMIVDLLRNDLGRVCRVGTVHVPKLMRIESYATVHQMVSTIRGTLDGEERNAIDVVEACFPGGSMTGAPKARTMDILEEIEEGVPRGPYSGCLGYVSLNGCMDMNIVIRSAILTPVEGRQTSAEEETSEKWKVSIGCGGAITALSDSEDEYEEMLLKSRVVRRTISDWVAGAM